MLRRVVVTFAFVTVVLGGCGHSDYAVRPVPRIAADTVGKPVDRLTEAFGEPRRIDSTPTKRIYIWFLPEKPPGAPVGLHGCQIEATVDIRSDHVLGSSLANVGWGLCSEIERKILIAER